MSAGGKGTVGVIGLGIMGGAISRNLAAAGWRVIGYDVDAAACTAAQQGGVEIAPDVAALAKDAATILTSLPKPAALMATAEAIAAVRERRIVAELSTFRIEDKTAAEEVLRKAGHVMLDCPLSGTGSQAKVKDLVIYASGDKQAIEALGPVFADFGRKTHDLGAFGNGMKMKFVANLLVSVHNVASAEAMVLGMKAGLDPHQLVELVTSGAGNSRVFELRAPMMADNRYDGDNVTMKVSIWQKDVAVIGEFARNTGVPIPTFAACEAIYNAAMSTGHAGHDTASVCAVLEAMAGMKRG
jgi:3-hydroxyisobutyrate dehydrogenase-like beta-hydroxyacid dehydrogenase